MTTVTKMCVGFMAGITVGILYAPAKGSKTRAKLNGMGDNIKEGWGAITDSLADKIEDADQNFKQKINEEVTYYNLSDNPGVVL